MDKILLWDCLYPSYFLDLTVAFFGALVGIAGAYSIYRISISQIRKDRLKYFSLLVKSFISTAKQQAEYCKNYSQVMLNEPFANNQLKLEANRDIKRLSEKMDQEGVYHAYLWKYERGDKSYKEFRNLYSRIDYLDFLFDDLIKTNERILEFMWQRKKEYQISFKKLKELIQYLSLDDEINREQPDFVKHATSLLKNFLDNIPESENLVESFNKVVEPLRVYIVEKVKKHPKATEIYIQLDDLVSKYYGIELQAKHNSHDYNYYSKELTKKAEELEEASGQIRDDF